MIHIIVLGVILVLIFGVLTKSKSKSKSKVLKLKKENEDKRLVYANGNNISFREAWEGKFEYGSVFDPSRQDWYFEISGLNSQKKIIFSSSWHFNQVLRQSIGKFEDILNWEIVVIRAQGSTTSPDVYKKLSLSSKVE